MAGTKIQFWLTLFQHLLAWHSLVIAALPIEVGVDTELFHAADTVGVYLNRNTKVWNFTTEPDATLLLSFSRISLQRPFDYITVGEGTIPSPRSEILRWSGEQKEDELMYLSSGNEMWLTSRRDNVGSIGFEGKVRKVDKNFTLSCPEEYRCGNQVCLTRNDICNGYPNCVTSDDEHCLEYVVVRPFYNLLSTTSKTGAQLGANYKYTWVFVTDSDSKLQLSFDFINTERHFDFVTVGEGSDPSANLLLSWSGEERKTLPTVTSSTFAMWLTLTTDENKQSPEAFSANLTQIKESQVTCGSGMFNCMNGVCLPDAYVCDDVIHCGSIRDESNENCSKPCPSSNPCGDGTCFEDIKKCDGSVNCPNIVDESGCSTPVIERLINTTNGRSYRRTFQNHNRTIMFTTNEGQLLVTFYLPQRVTRRTEVSVKSDTTSILSNVFDSSHSGFYNIFTNSTNMEFEFSTDSEISISATIVPTDYRQRCTDLFDCGNGLCIPENMYCDGVVQCTNEKDEPEICQVRACFTDEGMNCTEEDVSTTLEKLGMVNITTETASNVAEKLFNVSEETHLISGENIDSITDIVLDIVHLEQQAEVGEVTDSITGIVNNMYNVDSQSIADSTTVGVLPEALETQLGNAVSNSRNFTSIMLPNVRAVAAPVNQESLKEGISFGSTFLGNTSRAEPTELIHFSPPTIRAGVSSSEHLSSYIELPRTIGNKVTAGVNSSVPLLFVIYKNATIFPLPSESIINGSKVRQVISSQIIAASVSNTEVKNLPNDERVMTKFFSFPIATGNEETEKRSCVYWKYNLTLGLGGWDTDGCEMVQSNDSYVTCLCNHLTSFAVLVHVSTEPYQSNPVIDVISLVGSILSIIGLSICVVTSLAKKETRQKQPTQIHVNLSIALLALYVTFSIGIKATRYNARCKITASLIHFFCLSSMAWMSVEAFNMFMLFWTMRRNKIKHLLLGGCLFAWGLPFAVSLFVYLIDKPADYQGENDYCFLHPGVSLFIGFLLPIFVLFVFNSVVFVLITYRVSCRKIIATNEEARRKAAVARIKGPILFWILLGLSWIFGFLAILGTPLTIFFEILFSVCLSLQGVFMFYMITLNNPEIKVKLKRYKDLFTGAFERSITSQLPLRSFTSNQHDDVTVDSQIAPTT